MKKWLFGFAALTLFQVTAIAQSDDTTVVEVIADDADEKAYLSGKFNGTRAINGHSTRLLKKGELEYRIEHRFGDLAGPNNGIYTWFGLDNAADIRMAFEYGLLKNLNIGLGRSRGASNAYRSLLDGFIKYGILQEGKNAKFSLTALGTSTLTYQRSSNTIYDINYFDVFAHRLTYTAAAIATKKLGNRIEVLLAPTFVHRNYVGANDVNDLFALGSAIKCGITQQMGIVVEYYQLLNGQTLRKDYTNSLGVGVEFVTFGHTFTINLTNARGLTEAQFITDNQSLWTKGQFRLGFAVNRKFSW